MGRKQVIRPELPTITRHYDADGKRTTKGAPGAIARTEKGETYCVRLKDRATGKRVWHSLQTQEEAQAWKNLAELLERQAREAAGIKDPLIVHGRKNLAEHLADWLDALRDEGKTGAKQLSMLASRTTRLAELAKWVRLGDIDRASAAKALAGLRTDTAGGARRAGHEGRGARTRNHYLRHLKQFCGWAVEAGRLVASPVAGLKAVNVEADKRRARRSPSVEEVAKLMAYLEGDDCPIRREMTGPQRAMCYRVGMATGFRAKELRTLAPINFDLNNQTVTCRAAYGKSRKLAVQQLPPWLVDELREWLDAGRPLWSTFPEVAPGKVLKADLLASGIVPCVDAPSGKLWFDFHSLRHWYCTWAANCPGISPKTLQAMARHSTAQFTLDVYAKPLEREIRRAVDQIPDLRKKI